MHTINFFKTYFQYSRRRAQFDTLFALSQNLLNEDRVLSGNSKKTINLLNNHRINSQNLLGQLFLRVSSVCKECKGECCQKPFEKYFTAVDFWLRKL